MAVEYAFDIYPANDPAGKISTSGVAARLVRLTLSKAVKFEFWRVGHGYKERQIVLRIQGDHADATAANIAKRNYVKVMRIDTDPEQEIAGGLLEEGEFDALSTREAAGRMLEFYGPGGIFLLDRYVLGHSIYASGAVHRGDFDIPGQWTWSAEPLGAILLRSIEEGQDHPDAFFPMLTTDFTRTIDSNSNAWGALEDYQTRIGTSVLELYIDLVRQGLVVQCTPDLMIRAFRDIDEYRVDRTASVIFAGGVNVVNELTKRIRASMERTHVLYEDRTGDYVTIDTDLDGNPLAGVPYMTFMKSDTTAADPTIVRMGQMHLTRRGQYTNQATVRHLIGDDAPGTYAPGPAPDGDYDVLDLVSADTGTAEHDYVMQPLEVAAIRYFHNDAGVWFAETELGAQYIPADRERFQAQISSTIRQVRSLALCSPTQFLEEAETLLIDSAALSHDGAGPVAISTPPDAEDGDLLVVTGFREGAGATIPSPPVGAGWTAINAGYSSGGGVNNVALRTAWKIMSGDASSGMWDNVHGLSIVVFRGVDAADPIGDDGGSSETGSNIIEFAALTLEVADGTSRILSVAAALSGGLGDTLPSSSQLEVFGPPSVPNDFATYLSDGVSSWASRDLACSANDRGGQQYEIRAGEASIVVGAGMVDLVGTSTQAKRCDDTEHYHIAADPTVDDDEAAGFRPGTLWVNEATGALFFPLDLTAGAADWLPVGGNALDFGEVGDIVAETFGAAAAAGATGEVADAGHRHAMPADPVTAHVAAGDPHTGYQKESEKAAASGYASLDGSTKVPIAQLPTGTTSSTVSLGDHAHAGAAVHDESLTDGDSNFIFAGGDIVTVVGVPN